MAPPRSSNPVQTANETSEESSGNPLPKLRIADQLGSSLTNGLGDLLRSSFVEEVNFSVSQEEVEVVVVHGGLVRFVGTTIEPGCRIAGVRVDGLVTGTAV